MKAVRLLEYGGQLVFTDVPTPTIARDEILVKVKSTASGIRKRLRCTSVFVKTYIDGLGPGDPCRNAVLVESFLDWNVEGNRVHDAQALELHPNAVHAGTRKCHVELDVLLGT